MQNTIPIWRNSLPAAALGGVWFGTLTLLSLFLPVYFLAPGLHQQQSTGTLKAIFVLFDPAAIAFVLGGYYGRKILSDACSDGYDAAKVGAKIALLIPFLWTLVYLIFELDDVEIQFIKGSFSLLTLGYLLFGWLVGLYGIIVGWLLYKLTHR